MVTGAPGDDADENSLVEIPGVQWKYDKDNHPLLPSQRHAIWKTCNSQRVLIRMFIMETYRMPHILNRFVALTPPR